MDDIVVRVMRAIASYSRLTLLRLMAGQGEMTPTDLAKETGLSKPAVSLHLRHLASAGLVRRRPSGTRCFCVAKPIYGPKTLSGRMSSYLVRLFRSPDRTLGKRELGRMRAGEEPGVGSEVERAVFDAATAFTNLRRLRILDQLEEHGDTSFDALRRKLKMSAAALSRHVDKLVRRGYVEVEDETSNWMCRLAHGRKTPIHAAFLRIVRQVRKESPTVS